MSSAECEWCNGDGCDSCEIQLHNTLQLSSSMNNLSHAGTTHLINSPKTDDIECEWCDGAGCDECSSNLLPTTLIQQHSALLIQTSLTRAASQLLSPSFLQSPHTASSLNEDDVINYMAYKIHQLAQQFYTTFDDAEALLHKFLWNSDTLMGEWIQEQGSEKIRNQYQIYLPISDEPTPHTSYLATIKGSSTSLLSTFITISSQNQSFYNPSTTPNNVMSDEESKSSQTQGGDTSEQITLPYASCPICGDDDIPLCDMLKLPCGHLSHIDCLREYVASAVVTTGVASLNLTCPSIDTKDSTIAFTNENIDKCNTPLSFSLMHALLQEKDIEEELLQTDDKQYMAVQAPTDFRDTALLFKTQDVFSTHRATFAGRFRRFVAESFASYSRGVIQSCPSTHGCSLFIFHNQHGYTRPHIPVRDFPYTFSTLTNHTFLCPCGTFTCKCGQYGSHYLAQCDVAEKYLQCTDPEAMASKMIESTCKRCPKCSVLITKDRNCNHVTCSQCGYHFCWVCKGLWSTHAGSFYNCTAAVDQDAVDEHTKTLTSTLEVQNINYYSSYANQYKRFIEEILKLYWKKCVGPDKTTAGSSMIESIPTFADIIRQFYVACSVLQWSYCIMIYLPSPDINPLARILIQQQAWAIQQVSLLRSLLLKYLKDPTLLLDAQNYQSLDNRRKSAIQTVEKFYKALESFNTDELISYSKTKPISLDTSNVLVKASKSDMEEEERIPPSTTLNKKPYRSSLTTLVTTLPTNWGCALCSCLHVGSSSDLIFDDFEEKPTDQSEDLLEDITEKASSHRPLKCNNARYRGVMKNSSNKVICANCHACQSHAEPDCRLCFSK